MSEFEWAEGKGGGGRETSYTKAIVVAVAPLLLIPPPPHPVVLLLPLQPGAILFLLPFLAPPDTTADPGGGDASSFQISPPPSDRSPLSRRGEKNPACYSCPSGILRYFGEGEKIRREGCCYFSGLWKYHSTKLHRRKLLNRMELFCARATGGIPPKCHPSSLYVRILSQCFRRKCLPGIASNIRVSFQRKKRPLSSMHECRSLSLSPSRSLSLALSLATSQTRKLARICAPPARSSTSPSGRPPASSEETRYCLDVPPTVCNCPLIKFGTRSLA